jgi:hypothetical protein
MKRRAEAPEAGEYTNGRLARTEALAQSAGKMVGDFGRPCRAPEATRGQGWPCVYWIVLAGRHLES